MLYVFKFNDALREYLRKNISSHVSVWNPMMCKCVPERILRVEWRLCWINPIWIFQGPPSWNYFGEIWVNNIWQILRQRHYRRKSVCKDYNRTHQIANAYIFLFKFTSIITHSNHRIRNKSHSIFATFNPLCK